MTSLRRLPFALYGLFAVVAAIAVLAYVISAWQVFGFARHVWRLPVLLSFGAAVVADLLSLSGLFATYVLRDAAGRVRAYAWAVFLVMTGLSIAAAEKFAEFRQVDFAAQVASGSIVVALALAVHLLIVAVRHAAHPTLPAPAPTAARPARRKASTPNPEQPRRRWWHRKPKPADPETPDAAPSLTPPDLPELTAGTLLADQPAPTADQPAPARTRPPRPATPAPPATSGNSAPTGKRGRPIDPAEQARRDGYALQFFHTGGDKQAKQTTADAAGVSTRTIELWVASYRERHPDAPNGPARPDLKTPMLGPDDQPADVGNPQLTEGVNV